MELIAKYGTGENDFNEYEIEEKKDLIDAIKDYASFFIPINDEYGFKMLKEGNYKALLSDLKIYHDDRIKDIESKFNRPDVVEEIKEKDKSIDKIFILLGEVEKLCGLNDVINRLSDFNGLFKKTNLDFVFSIR